MYRLIQFQPQIRKSLYFHLTKGDPFDLTLNYPDSAKSDRGTHNFNTFKPQQK
jgi:hypothetical protein